MSLKSYLKSMKNGVKAHLRMIFTEPPQPISQLRSDLIGALNVTIPSARVDERLRETGYETDPYGRQPNELGSKLDAGKVCVFRGAISYFPRAFREVAAVSTFGAKKYAWKGWETVPDGVNRYSDALGRHLIEEGIGEVYDRDSGLLVAAHTAWNALARLELMLKEINGGTS